MINNIILKILVKVTKKQKYIRQYWKNEGLTFGDSCCFVEPLIITEPFLVKIGNNVTLSNYVSILNHDNSISKVNSKYTDFFGEVNIGNNCFIGHKAIIMPGVSLGEGVIVGAGSVVTKSFSDNCVIAGNPARKIMSTSDLKLKIISNALNAPNYGTVERREFLERNKEKFIKKQVIN